MRRYRLKILVCAGFAASATYSSTLHAEYPKTVGSWVIAAAHPDNREVLRLSAGSGAFSVDLVCENGPWLLFISEFSENDTADDMVPLDLTYSIDGSPPLVIRGIGHKRYRFEIHDDANAFVEQLMSSKKKIAFAIEPRKNLITIPIEKAREAITPYLDRCPLSG